MVDGVNVCVTLLPAADHGGTKPQEDSRAYPEAWVFDATRGVQDDGFEREQGAAVSRLHARRTMGIRMTLLTTEAAILALWTSHCQAKNRRLDADSAGSS